jgi:ankyrin repeat protein
MTNPGDLDDLHGAIKRGDLLALRRYLELGGHVDAPDRDGWTPLLMAAKQGHTPMVRTLLDAGADPNGRGSGFTPLVAAGLSGSGKSVAALLAAGADPAVAWGQPLVEIMRQYGHSGIVELLEAALAERRGRAV